MSNKRVFKTNSGEELPICPVSEVDLTPFINQLKDFTKPPVEIVEGVPVTNEADPAYLASLDSKNIEKGTFFMAVIIELGLDMELDDDQQAKVNRAKKKLEKINPNAQENQFDLYLYAKSICPSYEELTRLMGAIQGLNSPTAQQVQNALETFRPGIPGPAGHADTDAPKWVGISERQYEAPAVQGGALGGDNHPGFLRPVGTRVAG